MHSYSPLSMLFGIVIGIALTFSCGEDAPGHADAGLCDCSAAEPAISGRIKSFDSVEMIPAGARRTASIGCPQNAPRLAGGCTLDVPGSGQDITLEQSGFVKGTTNGWGCSFKNNEAVTVAVRASVICLMPPS